MLFDMLWDIDIDFDLLCPCAKGEETEMRRIKHLIRSFIAAVEVFLKSFGFLLLCSKVKLKLCAESIPYFPYRTVP